MARQWNYGARTGTCGHDTDTITNYYAGQCKHARKPIPIYLLILSTVYGMMLCINNYDVRPYVLKLCDLEI